MPPTPCWLLEFASRVEATKCVTNPRTTKEKDIVCTTATEERHDLVNRLSLGWKGLGRSREELDHEVNFSNGGKHEARWWCGVEAHRCGGEMHFVLRLPIACASAPNELERMRRQKIGDANRGRVPWNKGKTHSEETRRRIAESTRRAMARPEVRAKIALAKKSKEPVSVDTKKKIGEGVRAWWRMQREELAEEEGKDEVSLDQEFVTGAWTDEESAALLHGIAEHGKKWQFINREYKLNRRNGTALLKRFTVLQKHFEDGILSSELHGLFEQVMELGHAEKVGHVRESDEENVEEDSAQDVLYVSNLEVMSEGQSGWMQASSGNNRAKVSSKFYKSPEHRAKISQAIRAKWKDPEYRERMAKTGGSSARKKNQSTRHRTGPSYVGKKNLQRANLERKRAELQARARALKKQADHARKVFEESVGSVDVLEAREAYTACEQAQAVIDQALNRIESALQVSIASGDRLESESHVVSRQNGPGKITDSAGVHRKGRMVEGSV